MLLGSGLADAQPVKPIPRVGILNSATRSSGEAAIDAFRKGLRDLGYTEGKNIILEYRFADGERTRITPLASELVELKVDVILASGTQTAIAAKKATTTIPIVVGDAGDLVAAGLVATLARPGGNLTGSTRMAKDMNAKRVEVLKETVPRAVRLAIIMSSATSLRDRADLTEIEPIARHLGLKLRAVDIKDQTEFKNAYETMVRERADAVMIFLGSFTNFHRNELVELAVKKRLPSMCETAIFADTGCLVSYGPDEVHLWRRAAIFIDKILKGAKPADLPVEQPTKFELIINLKTAKQIGLTIPPNVLARADRVIK